MEPTCAFDPWHLEQDCSGSESLENGGHLTDSEIEMKKIKEMKYDVAKIKRTR